MDLIQIIILAIVQGAAELLPVSSSAHVIVAEKLMGLDPTAPRMTLLLVMLHTGTMVAVIAYFWSSWRTTYFASAQAFRRQGLLLAIATFATGLVGLALLQLIKHVVAGGAPDFEIEHLFGNAKLMAGALAAAGMLIIVSSRLDHRSGDDLTPRAAACIGAVQGLCLPFRGFSRSGATISAALAMGVARRRAEEFSFALAVVLTPAVIAKEAHRLYKADGLGSAVLWQTIGPSLLAAALSCVTGLVALRWLTRWLEHGRWHMFGAYCLVAALVVLWVG